MAGDLIKHVPIDLPCDHCGYNLRTRSFEARCPECGDPVADTLRKWLIHDHIEWYEETKAASRLLIWSPALSIACLISLLLADVCPPKLESLVTIVSGIGLAIGFVFLARGTIQFVGMEGYTTGMAGVSARNTIGAPVALVIITGALSLNHGLQVTFLTVITSIVIVLVLLACASARRLGCRTADERIRRLANIVIFAGLSALIAILAALIANLPMVIRFLMRGGFYASALPIMEALLFTVSISAPVVTGAYAALLMRALERWLRLAIRVLHALHGVGMDLCPRSS